MPICFSYKNRRKTCAFSLDATFPLPQKKRRYRIDWPELAGPRSQRYCTFPLAGSVKALRGVQDLQNDMASLQSAQVKIMNQIKRGREGAAGI